MCVYVCVCACACVYVYRVEEKGILSEGTGVPHILLQTPPIKPLSFVRLALAMMHELSARKERSHVRRIDRYRRAQVLLRGRVFLRTLAGEHASVSKIRVGVPRVDPEVCQCQ